MLKFLQGLDPCHNLGSKNVRSLEEITLISICKSCSTDPLCFAGMRQKNIAMHKAIRLSLDL